MTCTRCALCGGPVRRTAVCKRCRDDRRYRELGIPFASTRKLPKLVHS